MKREKRKTERTFLGIALPDEIKSAIQMRILNAKQKASRVKWVENKNIHLTLMFLGEITETQKEGMIEGLEGLATRIPRFGLEVTGPGVFPNSNRARVLWFGTDGETDPLFELHGIASLLARRVRIKIEDRAFHPHITVGRIKTPTRIDPEELLGPGSPERRDFTVDSFNLYASELTQAGPIYKILRSFTLTGSAKGKKG